MYELAGAITTLTGIIILYRSQRSLSKQRDILIRQVVGMKQEAANLQRIVQAHGCAPAVLVKEGTVHTCADCGSVWKADEVEVDWLDDTLKNVTRQSWTLTGQENK